MTTALCKKKWPALPCKQLDEEEIKRCLKEGARGMWPPVSSHHVYLAQREKKKWQCKSP